MIITIFGDVHGNLIALEKLFELEKSQTDVFISHGDIVNYGPWTSECVELLKDIPNGIFLKGNHEEFFINGVYLGTNVVARSFFEHCYTYFNKSLIPEISAYKDTIQIENFVIQHTISNQYIFVDTDISNLLVKNDYIIGHSHQQFERGKDNFKIYNTGSLGQNRQFINQSCYIKFDTITKKIEMKNFNHDINKVINKMKAEKYPSICLDYYLSKKQFQ